MSGFEDFTTPVLDDVSDVILAEGSKFPSLQIYLNHLEEHYADHKWTPLLKSLAEFVEPIDPALGIDSDMPSSTNFYRGGSVGMRVIETAQGTKFLPYIIGTLINTDFAPGVDDLDTRRHVQAENILGLGEIGLRTPDPNLQIATAWEDAICPDIRVQRFLHSGFGFILHVSHEIIRIDAANQLQADLQVMKNQIEYGRERDWSAGLGELGL